MGEEIRRKAKVVHKHEIAANWALSNYVPEIGEIVFYDPDDEFDYTRQKNGNGVDKVADLPFTTEHIETYIDEKTAGYTVTLDEHNLKTVEIGAENSLKLISGMGVNVVAPDGIYITSGDRAIELNPISEQVKIGDKLVATEEYVDNAIANIEVPGGEATIPDDLTINSLIIGEGEAADLSIAGGTTDIDTYGEKAGLNTAEIIALKAALALNGGIKESKADAPMSIALGVNNESTSSGAITLGYGNKSSGFNSTAIGALNEVSGSAAFTYGYKNKINNDFGVAFGEENEAGELALAGGILSKATGKGSIAFGNENTASGDYAVAIGGDNQATGNRSFACGGNTLADNNYAYAEGLNTKALGHASHAENEGTEAKNYAHAEGWNTKAYGDHSHAEGSTTLAEGVSSHAEGWKTQATAEGAHAQGYETTASGEASFAGGNRTIASQNFQTALGTYNAEDEDALFIIGNGDSNENRSNAFTVNKDGTAYLNGKQLVDKEYIDVQISALRDELKAYINEVFLNGAW